MALEALSLLFTFENSSNYIITFFFEALEIIIIILLFKVGN